VFKERVKGREYERRMVGGGMVCTGGEGGERRRRGRGDLMTFFR